jgi:hypothetical protein
MTMVGKTLSRFMIVLAAALVGMLWSGRIVPVGPAGLISTANAWIGRPATPLSYAGVARRTTRRAVTAEAVVGANAAAAAPYAAAPVMVAPAPGCYQVVNAYGQVMYQCP